MKTLVISDIHTRIGIAESIISKENPDKTVFLGDYFDALDDNLEITHQVGEWLKHSLTLKDRIHLLGNHDLSYRDEKHHCSGFSEGKLWAIKNSGVNLNLLKNYYMIDDILMTHAGLSNDFYYAYNHNERQVGSFLWNMTENNQDGLYNCSNYRGGRDAHAGIVWCDWNEFIPIKGVRQIFGHTGDKKVRWIDENYCIDTFGSSYALIDDDLNIKIKTFK